MPQMTIQGTNERVCVQAGRLIQGQAGNPLFLIEKLKKNETLLFLEQKTPAAPNWIQTGGKNASG